MKFLIFLLFNFLKLSLLENRIIELKDYKIKIEESKLEKDYVTFLFSIYPEKDDTLKFELKDNKGNIIMEMKPFPVIKGNKANVRFGFMNFWIEKKYRKNSLFLYIYERKNLICKEKIIEIE